jgi:hypothetical protein
MVVAVFFKYCPVHSFPGRTEKCRDASRDDDDNEFDGRIALLDKGSCLLLV